MVESGVRPQGTLLDHGQHTGLHQRGFSGATVTFNLQPAIVARAAACAEVFGIVLLLIAQVGQRFQRFFASTKKYLRVNSLKGTESKVRAAFDFELGIEARCVSPDGFEQVVRQRFGG